MPTVTPAASTIPAARQPKGRRPAPEPAEHFAHLDLAALRAYRGAVAAEEDRVSYWRRIMQAKLDVVQAEAARRPVNLVRALHSARLGAGRTALVRVVPADDIPPLPDLAGLWTADPADDASRVQLVAELTAAERRLSDYRAALHRRLDAATAELVARYRRDPGLCDSALPVNPLRRRHRHRHG